MTGQERAAAYIQRFEDHLICVAQKRVADPVFNDDMNKLFMDFERHGWVDVSALPVRVRRLVTNLVLSIAHVTPPGLTAGVVKMAFATAFFVAGVYEEEQADSSWRRRA